MNKLREIEFSPFLLACRQLELQGFCPYEKNNVLDNCFYVCPVAKQYGVLGCHICIKKYFEADFENRPK